MSAELPARHISWVFAGLMHRAGLMSWAEFEAELTQIFGPDFGPAIADRAVGRPSAGDPKGHRRDRWVPRRI